MAARDQVRRISHARPPGPRQGPAVDADGPGLDAQIPVDSPAVSTLPARQAYLDGELCGVRPDGKTSFSLIQTASDGGNADALVFFLFDLLYLDDEMISTAPLRERKERLRQLLSHTGPPLQFSDHQIGRGPEFYAKVCEMSLEGIISKRADASYSPGDRGLWVKVKCENREESWLSAGRAHTIDRANRRVGLATQLRTGSTLHTCCMW